MKRVLLTLAVALLIPGMLGAATMGVYFDGPGQMTYTPAGPFSFFDVYIYLHAADYYVTAVEYALVTPLDPTHTFFSYNAGLIEYPDNMSITDGDPFGGHSIAFWPPLNGYSPGYNMLVTLRECFITGTCWPDYPLVIGPNPASGELRGTFMGENEFFPIVGLTSFLCPEEIAVEQTSWGAIKSLFE